MVDFIKIEIDSRLIPSLKRNPLLAFSNIVDMDTGEIKGKYENAKHKGLEFKIYYPTVANPKGRVTMEGSLHKYNNEGEHNYNDFSNKGVFSVVSELSTVFGINPKTCILRQLELGVNIKPPIATKQILKGCLLHKTSLFETQYCKDEGTYYQVRRQKKVIKLYDKANHYRRKGFEIPNEIMRFEIKFIKMYELNQRNIYTLNNLLETDFTYLLIDVLQTEWNNILYYDKSTHDKTKYKDKYSNLNFWTDLINSNYELFKYHKRNLKSIAAKDPDNIHYSLSKLIGEKIVHLNKA